MEIQNQHDVIDHDAWVGREEVRSDRVDLRIAQGLAVTLDYEPSSLLEGDSLPALWHWVYFTPNTRTNEWTREAPARVDRMARRCCAPCVSITKRIVE